MCGGGGGGVCVSMGIHILLYTCVCVCFIQLPLFPDFYGSIRSSSRRSLTTPGTDVYTCGALELPNSTEGQFGSMLRSEGMALYGANMLTVSLWYKQV